MCLVVTESCVSGKKKKKMLKTGSQTVWLEDTIQNGLLDFTNMSGIPTMRNTGIFFLSSLSIIVCQHCS